MKSLFRGPVSSLYRRTYPAETISTINAWHRLWMRMSWKHFSAESLTASPLWMAASVPSFSKTDCPIPSSTGDDGTKYPRSFDSPGAFLFFIFWSVWIHGTPLALWTKISSDTDWFQVSGFSSPIRSLMLSRFSMSFSFFSRLRKEKQKAERALERLTNLYLYSDDAMSEKEYIIEKEKLIDHRRGGALAIPSERIFQQSHAAR